MREHDLQIAVAQFLALCLPPESFCTSIDHGAGRMEPIAAKLRKARGVQRGIPDVLVLANGVCLFIELKALKGRLSPEQIEVGQKIRANGFGWEVCRSLTEVELACRKHGIELRGRMAA